MDINVSNLGLSRLEASIVFEALSTGCVSTAAYMTIHKYKIHSFIHSFIHAFIHSFIHSYKNI
jgi:hypothetical protein